MSRPLQTVAPFVRKISRSAIHRPGISHFRPAPRFAIRSIATAAAETASPSRPAFLRRAFTYTACALGLTIVGVAMAVSPAYQTVSGYMTPVSDEDTLQMWTPSDPETQALEDQLNANPYVQSLRQNPAFNEHRPHLKIPPAWRAHNLTGGTLMGPGKVPMPPLGFIDTTGEKKEFIQISYVGADLCGHPGIVHGGFLATMLDEGVARPAFEVLPHRVGMTANLNVNYRAPCKANQFVVLKAEVTKAEGRKAWVEGRIETLPEGDEKPVELANATALYIEPKQAAALRTAAPVT
ncbi:HotDog domain-containing protein [Diaporthe sp. PMI_573]|nr:HotDog domain-containing protein [Diaporthaceae sp. PMI_573]